MLFHCAANNIFGELAPRPLQKTRTFDTWPVATFAHSMPTWITSALLPRIIFFKTWQVCMSNFRDWLPSNVMYTILHLTCTCIKNCSLLYVHHTFMCWLWWTMLEANIATASTNIKFYHRQSKVPLNVYGFMVTCPDDWTSHHHDIPTGKIEFLGNFFIIM